MTPILQNSIPYDVSEHPKLPGVKPCDMEEILIRDEAHAGQMAERDRLLRDHRAAVLQIRKDALPAAQELLELVLGLAYPDAGAHPAQVTRPDGVSVAVDFDDPMGSLGRLVQEDFCILQKQGDEHVLTGAVLCFPASWMLSEKFERPLIGIHEPVESYDAPIAARVQRLFDGVQPGRPLWRFNALPYNDPSLHLPRSQYDRRDDRHDEEAGYVRSERQVIVRLPQTRTVVFAIHTFIVARDDDTG